MAELSSRLADDEHLLVLGPAGIPPSADLSTLVDEGQIPETIAPCRHIPHPPCRDSALMPKGPPRDWEGVCGSCGTANATLSGEWVWVWLLLEEWCNNSHQNPALSRELAGCWLLAAACAWPYCCYYFQEYAEKNNLLLLKIMSFCWWNVSMMTKL